VSFTLYNVPPDAAASIAPDGTPVALTTTVPGQGMQLTFNGTAGQRVSLLVQPVSGSIANVGSGVQIIEPDGSTQLYNNCACSGLFTGALVLPVMGTYTIVLSPNSGTTGTESFRLYNVPDAVATITPGATVSLTTTAPGQRMELTFNGTAGQRVSLLVSSVSGGIVGNLQIVEPDGSTQIYNNCACSGLFSGVVNLPATGIYTIVLNPGNTATGTDSFTLYDIPPDVTGTTSVGQAPTNYTTAAPGQAIRVSFMGAASQSVTVNVVLVSSTPSGACYNITTLKPDGNTLRGDGSCSSGYSSGSLILPAAGTYTMVVAPNSASIGTFSIGVSTP